MEATGLHVLNMKKFKMASIHKGTFNCPSSNPFVASLLSSDTQILIFVSKPLLPFVVKINFPLSLISSPILASLQKYPIWAGGWNYPPTCPKNFSTRNHLEWNIPLTCSNRVPSDDQFELYQVLDTLDIPFIIQPYFPKKLRTITNGLYPKNIVLKDRKGQFYYILIPEDKILDLKKLKTMLNAYRNFSFASRNELYDLVKCDPGAVSPFGLLFCKDMTLTVIVDKSLVTGTALNFHPLIETEAMVTSFESLQKFASFCDFEMKVLSLPGSQQNSDS